MTSHYGIKLVIGEPGSGKSWFMVRRLLDWVADPSQRRPVYTNLPIRWQVMRKYLRDRVGEEASGVIQPLTEDHFRRFLDRAQLVEEVRLEMVDAETKRLTALKAEGKIKHIEPRVSYDAFHTEACRRHGPSIESGPDANWLPAGASLVLDELQLWFPMDGQKTETTALLRYLSMHRHFEHELWCISQSETELNIKFRKMSQTVIIVYNKTEQRLVWGLKFKHILKVVPRLGLAFGYQVWSSNIYFSRGSIPLEAQRPDEEMVYWPLMRKHAVVFRLYESLTRVGSRRSLDERRKKWLMEHGLSSDGRTPNEVQRDERFERRKQWARKSRMIGGTARLAWRWTVRIGCLVLGFLVGFNISGGTDAVMDPAAVVVADDGPDVTAWGEWGGSGEGFVRIDGIRYGIGDIYGDFTLRAASARPAATAWSDSSDDVWVWRRGEDRPSYVGSIASVRAATTRRSADSRGLGVTGTGSASD